MVALKTFNNLSPDRQAEIIQVCLKEFALNDFQTASLTTIVKDLNLAKGSFYRYFESKTSLYYFLLDHCIQLRLQNDRAFISEPPAEFFDFMQAHLRAKIQFDRIQPLASAFLHNVLQEKNSEELGNIAFIRKQKALDIIEDLVRSFVAKGQLRADLDARVLAWNVFHSHLAILSYVEHYFEVDTAANIKAGKSLYEVPEEEILKVAAQFVEIEKKGIQA